MSSTAAADYKARKEAFVSNLSGSSITDINLVTLVAPSAILLWTVLQKRASFFTPCTPLAFGVDLLLNVCAILFAFTAYSSAPLLLNILLALPAILLLVPLQPPATKGGPNTANASSSSSTTSRKSKGKTVGGAVTPQGQQRIDTSRLPIRPFLTNYRGAMMVATVISILAVDFDVFPRRFAKVETWGTSLMDLGVGSFVFSAGVVSARSVLQSASTAAAAELQQYPSPMIPRFLKPIKHSIPLLVLGFARLISVKNLEYAEHVTEYGVHWNFFFTLALLPPCVELVDVFTEMMGRSSDLLAIQIAVMYEITLDNTDLLSYIITAPRGPDLLSMNREGVYSFVGYLSIFLCGRRTGKTVCQWTLPPDNSNPSTDKRPTTKGKPPAPVSVATERLATLRSLSLLALTYTVMFFATTHHTTFGLTVSRRLANLPYVMWIAAFNNAQLLLFGAIEHFAGAPETASSSSRVLRAFNGNGLAVFLVANLCTGLVNLGMDTLGASRGTAILVLTAYVLVVTGVALGLDVSGVKLKL